MKVEVIAQPIVYLSLDIPTVDCLMKLSKHHYDGTCKTAGRCGGFLYGWNNIVQWNKEGPAVQDCRASMRDLGLTLKLTEMANILLTPEEQQVVSDYCKVVMEIIHQVNNVDNWHILDLTEAVSKSSKTISDQDKLIEVWRKGLEAMSRTAPDSFLNSVSMSKERAAKLLLDKEKEILNVD